MSAEIAPERPFDRRFLMRGGAVLAGAAGISAVGAALAPTAEAATGQFMVVGQPNSADLTTLITENGTPPTLSLVNSTGPTLKLNPLSNDFDTPLSVGEIVNTEAGPLIGVDVGDGAENTYLATGFDLDVRPMPIPIGPARIMDTRLADDRSTIVGSSTAPFDSKGQLKAEAYIDIFIVPLAAGPVSAVFANLTVAKPSGGGFLSAYASGFDVPTSSNLNFQPNVTVANSAFIAVGVVDDVYAIRVYVTKATHVIVDLTGVVFGGQPMTVTPPPPPPRQAQQARRLQKMRNAVAKTARR